ncbi:hypothetical protein ACX818_001316 [Acinetobacter baumannii]
MKRLKLHRKSHLIEFASQCNKVIASSPFSDGIQASIINSEIKSGNIRGVWRMFSGNKILWEDGYCIFLPIHIRLTFKHYRDLSANKQSKQLSRKLKEHK